MECYFKRRELTPFTNLPGLVELKEQVGEDHTSWDTNLYLNRFINISEFVAVEMTGEWALGGIMSKGWKLLKRCHYLNSIKSQGLLVYI